MQDDYRFRDAEAKFVAKFVMNFDRVYCQGCRMLISLDAAEAKSLRIFFTLVVLMLWIIECAAEGAISVVEMLFSTSLVAVVGAGEQVGFPTFEHTADCVNMVVMWLDWQKLSC